MKGNKNQVQLSAFYAGFQDPKQFVELTREGMRNHVTVVYHDGTQHHTRNVHSVTLDRTAAELVIYKVSSKTNKVSDGVTRNDVSSEQIRINVGQLAGVEVRHVDDSFANRIELQTELAFTGRGRLGNVIEDAELVNIDEEF